MNTKLTNKLKISKKFLVYKNNNYIKILFVITFAIIGLAVLADSSAIEDPRASLPAVRSFGIFPGFGNASGLAKHEAVEKEMGRKIQNADGFLSLGSESNFNSTSWGLFEAPDAMFCKRPDVTVNLGVPLNFGPGSSNLTAERLAENRRGLQATANGERDSSYRLLGERLMKCGQKNAILRISSEMDIPWNAYTMVGNEDVFKDAFRHVVNLMRAIPNNNFKIDYMGNGDFMSPYTTRTGLVTTRAEAAFPGPEYVDIIGIDIYNRNDWTKNKAKLDFTQAMAKKYGKPMSIPEWGLWIDETGDDPQFIQNMYDWMNTTPITGPGALFYNAYFYNYVQSDLTKAPNSRALLNKLFGVPVSNPNIPNTSSPQLPAPAINFSSALTSVNSGGSTTLNWSSTNAKTCTASGAWTGSKALSGSQSTGNITSNSTYTLTCNGDGGSSSKSVTVTVTTTPPPPPPPATNLPNVNIVAGSLKTVPANPVAGQEVALQVTIRNDGTGATPAGVKHGVSFWINNSVIAWSDDSTASLAPGATRVLTTNGGFDGNATWTAVQGTNIITAKWDDVIPARFTESDSIKDVKIFTVTVAAAPTPPPPTDTTKPILTVAPVTELQNTTLATINVVASDNVAIDKVILRIAGTNTILATDTTSPYNLYLNTFSLVNGNYNIETVAYDAAGNTTTTTNAIKVRLPDISRDGKVDITDLTQVIASWNQNNTSKTTNIAHDLNNDGVVGIEDLTILIGKWTR